MTANREDLELLPDTAPGALRRFRAEITGHPLTVGGKGAVLIVLGKCADELERLAREQIALTAERDHARSLQRRAESELAELRRKITDDYERGRQDGIEFGPSTREQIDIARELDDE